MAHIPKKNRDAYRCGLLAYATGRTLADNPFPLDTHNYQIFVEAWSEADREARGVSDPGW